jgi:hypothetical protein
MTGKTQEMKTSGDGRMRGFSAIPQEFPLKNISEPCILERVFVQKYKLNNNRFGKEKRK